MAGIRLSLRNAELNNVALLNEERVVPSLVLILPSPVIWIWKL